MAHRRGCPFVVKGTFTFVSLKAFSEKGGIPPGWFAISHNYIDDKSLRRLSYGRWFKISTINGAVYRILRFSPNLKGTAGKPGEIVIDWGAWLDISGRKDEVPESLEIEIKKAKIWEYAKLSFSHPDPSFRLASHLALISLVLCILSLILAAWSLLKTYFS